MSDPLPSGDDPRLRAPAPDEDLAAADLAAAPAVPRAREGLSLWVGLAVLAVVAVATCCVCLYLGGLADEGLADEAVAEEGRAEKTNEACE